MKLLLKNGAKVDLQNKNEESALDFARHGSHAEVIDLLNKGKFYSLL